MIITLKGANFASSNIGTLDSWLISKSLTGVTIDNTATSVKKGGAYKAVITLKENYTFPDTITVTMGGTDITSTYVTKTSTTITINIPSVTGNIVIRVNATSNVVGVTYSITRTLTALTAGSNVNTITSGDTYEETFSIPKDMYDGYAGASGVEVDLTVKMGGSTLAPNTGAFTAELVYQQVSGVERATGFKVTVPNVSGNIAITATSYVPFDESIANTKVYHYTEKDKSIDVDGVSIGDVLIYANVSGAKVHGWTIPAGAKLTVTYKNTKAILSSEAMVLLHKTSNNVLDYKSTYIAAAGIGSTSTFTFTNVYNDEVLLEANEGVIVSGRYTVVGGGITPGEGGTGGDVGTDTDADATAFITAASITDTETQTKLNTLVKSLKSNNLWNKIDALYPCVGSTFEQMSYNLKNPTTFKMRSNSGTAPEVDNTGIKPTQLVICDNYTTASGQDFHTLAWDKDGYTTKHTLRIAICGVSIGIGNGDNGVQVQFYDNGTEGQAQIRTNGKSGRWNKKPCDVNPTGLVISSLTSGMVHNGVDLGAVMEGTPNLTNLSTPIGINGVADGTDMTYLGHRGLVGFGKGLTIAEMQTYSRILNEFKNIY